VYVFLGREQLPIYVGKSVNVRRRVQQHLSRPPSSERHFREMAAGVFDLRSVSTGTELHALVLEDQLIKELRPAYNRRQKKFLNQRYLELSSRGPAGLSVVSQAKGTFGRSVFGPFSDEYYAARLAALTSRYFGLGSRTPAREEPPEDLPAARAFLTGESAEVLERIRGEVSRHRATLAFELAAAARDRLRFCESFLAHQRFFLDFKHRVLLVEDRARASRGYFLFVRGRLRHHGRRRPAPAELRRLGASDGGGPPESDLYLYDRASLVRAWIAARAETRGWAVLGSPRPGTQGV